MPKIPVRAVSSISAMSINQNPPCQTRRQFRVSRPAQLMLSETGGVVFCSSDQIAHGVLIEAAAGGLNIPRDIAVIGFGDQDFAAHTNPALTTVRVDRDYLGRAAANALLARVRHEQNTKAVYDIAFKIIKRQTA